jgi:hypothetical protein
VCKEHQAENIKISSKEFFLSKTTSMEDIGQQEEKPRNKKKEEMKPRKK